jgi:transglutaminase-like putative cysteine protease
MPLLTINHKTVYRYDRPVAFGEHRIMLRPRDGHDLRVLSSSLDISPQPMRLRWIHDVFGNSVAIATFDERAEGLVVHLDGNGGAQSGGGVCAHPG